MPLKDMRLNKKDQKKFDQPDVPADTPKFPFGLRVHLEEEVLDKLPELDPMPKVGEKLAMIAVVEVVGIHQNQTASGKRRHIDVQITELGFEDESKAEKAAEALYGGKKS